MADLSMGATLVELQIKSPKTGQWVVHHHGVGLLYPERYVERLAAKDKVGRCVDPFSRMVIAGEGEGKVEEQKAVQLCPLCEEAHDLPFDGMCLL